jgi:lipopolysaccharide export system permease protein
MVLIRYLPGSRLMLRLIDRYIARELLTSAFFAVFTLSFVLVLGEIFKQLFKLIFDHNIPATYIITFIAYFLPLSLIYSIPWGLLTAVLLVFGRLSAANELTALRTAGVSIPTIARPVLLVAVAFSGVCLWINLYVAPRAQQNLKDAFFEVATNNPAAAFGGDQVIDQFPGKKIYVGSADGKRLENIHVFNLNSSNQAMEVVYARRGSLETDLANKQIKMRLENSRYEQRDVSAPGDFTKIHDGITMGDFVYPISLEELYAKKAGRRRVESFTFEELTSDLAKKRGQLSKDEEKLHQPHTDQVKREVHNDKSSVAEAATELNKRFSFSMACMTFALIGIPLGITAHRQETSAGFGLSLVVAVTYFLIIIMVNTIRSKAPLHPELLIWLPNVIFLIVGGILFLRLTRR